MIDLIPSLTSIALIDSLSIIPLCIVFLVVLLAGPQPVVRSMALIAGIFVVYLACGVLVLFGLQQVFDQINAYALRLWTSPYTEELIFQIVVGAALMAFGWHLAERRAPSSDSAGVSTMTAPRAWLAGAGLTLAGLPGAVPYVAAIDLTLRTDLTFVERLALLGYYNIVFAAPLVAIVAIRLVFARRADRILGAIRRAIDRWVPRVIVGLLIVCGGVLVADGIGWFLGYPLIPV